MTAGETAQAQASLMMSGLFTETTATMTMTVVAELSQRCWNGGRRAKEDELE